ncbi:MAG: hypothetical protein Q7S28_03545 [bacterium]|nr:hypothetical protein [bacterium]
MKTIDIKRVIIGTVLGLVTISTYLLYFAEDFSVRNPAKVGVPDISETGSIIRNMIDWNNDKEVVGAHDVILVGKVVERVGGNAKWNSDSGQPNTLFDVEVIYNVKGNDRGIVHIMQHGFETEGGVRVIQSYDPLNEILVDAGSSLLLKPGSTYLLLLTPNSKYSRYFLAYSPQLQKVISNDNTLTNEQLSELVRRDERVRQLLVAYANEVPSRAGILNRFDLLSESEKQEVFEKFANLLPPQAVPEITPKHFDFSEPVSVAETTIVSCTDGIDNDKDGLADSVDSDCKGFFIENNPGLCRDKSDDDFDGLIDAADPDCAAFYPPAPQPAPPPPPPAPSPAPAQEPTSTPATMQTSAPTSSVPVYVLPPAAPTSTNP